MKNTNAQFTEEQEKTLKRYIKETWFEALNDLVNICDLSSDENTILQNIKDYIWTYIINYKKEEFYNGAEKLIQFFDSYKSGKEPRFTQKGQGGLFDITEDLLYSANGYHIYGKFKRPNSSQKIHSTNGFYSIGAYIGTDRAAYLGKRSMISKNLPVKKEIKKQVDYNSIVAQFAFEYFDQPVARYYLLEESTNPYNVILSKNFLQDNQELVHFSDLYDGSESTDTYLGRIAMMESNIEMRYKNILGNEKTRELLDKLRLQYCRQEFMKLVIGPMDCNLGNTSLLLTSKAGQDVPEIDISPAYDLDLSFNVAQNLASNGNMRLMKTSDGKSANIHALIEDFREIPGFKDFLDYFYRRIDNKTVANEIVGNAYEKTNFQFFSENAEQYIDFLNNRFEQVREAYRAIFLESRGDDENEAILE